MEPWLIALIVVLCVLFIVLPSIIFTISGFMTVKMLRRCDVSKFNVKGIDISFYQNGPLAPLAEEGMEYVKTLEKEEVYISSYDGYKLHAYIIKNPNKTTNKYFIGMHGFKSYALREYAPYIKKYFDLGFNMILPDERAHSKSEGKYLTMGVKERYDVLSWANYAVKRFGENIKIVIQGISMGGASVCLASNLDLPKQVVGIVSDCAYGSMKEEMKATMSKNFKVPSFPLVNIINIYLKLFVGISFKDESALEAVKHAKVPMVFFHGAKDQMVPVDFAKQLYENCPTKKALVINPLANHAETMPYEGENYYHTIMETFGLDKEE